MAGKARILFVVSEPLGNGVVVSQALTHIRLIQRAGVADIRILAMGWGGEGARDQRKAAARAAEIAEADVAVAEGVRPALPFSGRINASRAWKAVTDLAGWVTHVHGRTDYGTLCGMEIARRLGVPLIWDCRGDAVDEIRFRGAGPLGPVMRRRTAARLDSIARRADRALFVSEPLRARQSARWAPDKPSWVVPCAASRDLFFFDPVLRRDARAELGVADNEILTVYSGGLASYQMFPETVALWRAYRRRNPNVRLLVLTPAAAEAGKIIGDMTGAAVMSVHNDRMNRYLNAADAGFMLRASTPANHVASPTKFAEYALTGLSVVMTGTVIDSHRHASDLGLLIEADAGALPNIVSAETRAGIAGRAAAMLGREDRLPVYEAVYAPAPRGGRD